MNQKTIEEQITDVMEEVGNPITTETISILIQRDIRDVSEKMSTLQKFGIVKKVTTKEVSYFIITK